MSETMTLTESMTGVAKTYVAKRFHEWVHNGGMERDLNGMTTRTAKCYVTERTLARLVAAAVAAHGDYVARGVLIDYAAGLSSYVDRDVFEAECVSAFNNH